MERETPTTRPPAARYESQNSLNWPRLLHRPGNDIELMAGGGGSADRSARRSFRAGLFGRFGAFEPRPAFFDYQRVDRHLGQFAPNLEFQTVRENRLQHEPHSLVSFLRRHAR